MLVPPVAAGECQVWWATAHTVDSRLHRLLDGPEAARADRFRWDNDRALYVVAHALARLLLAPYVDRSPAEVRFAARCRGCGGPHGKPEVVGAPEPVAMSLSHAGRRVAVALSRDAVGVDVEVVDRELEIASFAHAVLSPAERETFFQLPADRRHAGLLTYWTRKEAVLKATGDGLAIPTEHLTVTAPAEPAGLVAWTDRPDPPTPVHLVDLSPGAGYVGALAALGPVAPRVTEHDATALLATAVADRPAAG